MGRANSPPRWGLLLCNRVVALRVGGRFDLAISHPFSMRSQRHQKRAREDGGRPRHASEMMFAGAIGHLEVGTSSKARSGQPWLSARFTSETGRLGDWPAYQSSVAGFSSRNFTWLVMATLSFPLIDGHGEKTEPSEALPHTWTSGDRLSVATDAYTD